jgi:hypothetical protein
VVRPAPDYSKVVNDMLWRNGQIAYGHKNDNIKDRLLWFYNGVKTDGPWDLKNENSWKTQLGVKYLGNNKAGIYEPFMVFGQKIDASDLANINFGYTGVALGLDMRLLRLGAGAAQVIKEVNWNDFNWSNIPESAQKIQGIIDSIFDSPTLGDQKDDYKMVGLGMVVCIDFYGEIW